MRGKSLEVSKSLNNESLSHLDKKIQQQQQTLDKFSVQVYHLKVNLRLELVVFKYRTTEK